MKTLIRKIVETLLPRFAVHFRAYYGLIKDRNSYLYSTGWMQSLEKEKPVDQNGNPIPWMNFPTIKFLEDKLKKELTIFEFGSGYSTFFYAKKVKSVTAVEYDNSWFQRIKSEMPGNVELIYQKLDVDGEYCRVIRRTNQKFDVVVIDGRDRVNCLKQSVATLAPRGVILLDDSQREKYKEGLEFAAEQQFRVLNLEGLKATGTGLDRTSIFYWADNCLGI